MNGTDEQKYQIQIVAPASGVTIGEKNQVSSRFSEAREVLPEHVWNVAYRRNPFFTGRERLLKQLHQCFVTDRAVALTQEQAINGLGGVGKTQVAVEYAYRHQQDYRFILWVSAATPETLVADFIAIADQLQLPERSLPEQDRIVATVKRWLATHSDWLLIVDNADNLDIVWPFLPTGSNTGHLLLTTRQQAVAGFESFRVEQMDREEGTLLLLRRAHILGARGLLEQASPADRQIAEQIVEEMDGLPVALDQAGAYMEETGCDLSTYLKYYQIRRASILIRRDGSSQDHPASVEATLSLSFQQIKRKSPAAADLLRFCAFVHPDAIPEDMIGAGLYFLPTSKPTLLKRAQLWFFKRAARMRTGMSPSRQPGAEDTFLLLLEEAISLLEAYSLLRRDATEKTLSIHHLVQVVLRDEMDQQSQQQWTERTVRAVNAAFPEVEFAQWSACERFLPHAKACCGLMAQDRMSLSEVTDLLTKMGWYLRERGQYQEAEALLQQALMLRVHNLGSEHLDIAQSLTVLGGLYRAQRKYEQAEPLYQRALSIREKQLGPEHPSTASSLNALAVLYRAQGKYEQAEPLYWRVLAGKEQQLGLQPTGMARSLNNLALLYYNQGKYKQAELLFERILASREQQLGPEDPDTPSSLSTLAELYQAQGKYEQAEPLYQRALTIDEKALGTEHPNVATGLNNLAALYSAQGKYEQAEPLYQRALTIHEQRLGPEHPDTALSLNNLAALYDAQSKYEQAEPLYQRALSIREKQLGPEHPDTAISLNNLAGLYQAQRQYEQAEPLYQRALAIKRQQLGLEHPSTISSLNNLALLYESQGKYEQAEPLLKHTLAVKEHQLGPEHPSTASSLHNLAGLYKAQGKYQEAEPLYQRALAICENQLGPEHPYTRIAQGNYISLLRKLGREVEANNAFSCQIVTIQIPKSSFLQR